MPQPGSDSPREFYRERRAGGEAIFLSSFVLVSRNDRMRVSERRSQQDLRE